LTAVANDYSFDEVFARLIEARGKKGDLLIALSTSGNSPNVVRALETARKKELRTIGLTGEGGGRMAPLCDLLIAIPSRETPRIQEAHITIGHILCAWAEQKLFG
jgi:D-sedoheptulose 7-phosphate isomerase